MTPGSILPVLLLVLFSCQSLAQVYRWVDENGQVHFGAQPPQRKLDSAEHYQLRVPQASSTPIPAQQTSTASEQKAEAGSEPSATQEKLKVSKQDARKYCDQAQKYKEAVNGNSSRRFKQEDGSYRPLTDEERASYNSRADEVMKEYCR